MAFTHRHTDLQDEFRSRIAKASSQPPVLLELQEAKAEAQQKTRQLTADVTALTATIRQLERIIHVLALENDELRLNRTQSDKIVPLRPGERHRQCEVPRRWLWQELPGRCLSSDHRDFEEMTASAEPL